MRSTRSGWPTATCVAHLPPAENATSTARSTPASSITATVSRAKSSAAYPWSGLSDAPFPRPSNVTTRTPCRAKYGTCIFHTRLCTNDQVGTITSVRLASAGP